MAKGNKEILASINYSMDIVKRIKANETFTYEQKQKILDDYIGLSQDNNSYFTPIVICSLIKELLNIKSGKVADLSAGIGNMVRPFVSEYGKLSEDVTFDCFELDENNSAAGYMAWSDYEQVQFQSDFNTIDRHSEIQNDHDYIIGNPPFSGSVPYKCEWNNNKGKIKNNSICDAFIDLAINKVKPQGHIALVLPTGHLSKGNATAKLREWMRSQVALKAVIPLDSDTFAEAGVQGTGVGTVLCIWQKAVKQGKVFIGELSDKKDIASDINALIYQYRLFESEQYDIEYTNSVKSVYGKLKPSVKPWGWSASV
ncbi:N-6 DNA methylase [Paenibacillus sp. FSL P4-0502]|uniref:N-6 DNA methylase n=1 Tax=Paenibacillus sp. FSL P4-0502 TaxID=2975319 RepID=UPI0030FB61DD